MKLPKIKGKSKKFKKDDNSYLIVDITKKTVKVLLVNETDGNKVVKGVSTKEIPENSDKKAFIEATIQDCFMQAGVKTDKAIIGLGGPDVFGFILITKIKREFPDTKIADREIEEIYSKVRNASYKQAKNIRSTFYADNIEFETLDLVVTSTYLDDKMVHEPDGETGEVLTTSVYCSYAEHAFYEDIMKVIRKLGIHALAVTTTLYSQVKLLSEEHKNFVVVDIGKTYTDFAIIFGKNIIQTRSFEMGGDFFTSYLADKMNLDFNTANGKKEAYALGTLPQEEADEVGDILFEAGKYWRVAFSTVLGSMTGIKSLPKDIILSGGGANLTVLQELLFDEEWRNAIPFAGELEIDITSTEQWSKYLNDELKVLDGPRMFVPASLAIVKHELEEENE